MTARQLALEEQIANLSIVVQGANNFSRKDNLEDGRNNSDNNNALRDKNNSQMGGGVILRYSKIEFPLIMGQGTH